MLADCKKKKFTLCIKICTIDICIQEVLDLGRGKDVAVLPEFQIFEKFNAVYSDISD